LVKEGHEVAMTARVVGCGTGYVVVEQSQQDALSDWCLVWGFE
jgi:hypothetical protein